MSRMKRTLVTGLALAAAAPAGALAAGGASFDGSTLFVRSASEAPDSTVTLPLHRGSAAGDTVLYAILDTSDGALARSLGVNRASKLANARVGTGAQAASGPVRALRFSATVDFGFSGTVTGPNGADLPIGARGDAGYSPVARLSDGRVVNAPQLARDADGDGRFGPDEVADKVVRLNLAAGTVTLRETHGFQGGRAVRYISTDASIPLAAALEGATLAPALGAAPSAGDDSGSSARASLAAFVNGQTGAANPERQGIGSALSGDGDPLNVLSWNPTQGRYSPLWDVFLTEWTPDVVAAGANVRQTDFGTVTGLASHGLVTSPGGGSWGAAGAVVNCPIISRQG